MKKKDLKTGMEIYTDSGNGLLLLDTNDGDFIVYYDGGGWDRLHHYIDSNDEIRSDVVKIIQPKNHETGRFNSENIVYPEKGKEMTLEQVNKELGFKVKIIE